MPEKVPQFPIHHAWPPLVKIKSVSSIIRLRDIAITISAWTILAVLLETTILLVVDWVSHPFGELSYTSPPDWDLLLREFSLFICIVFGLIFWIGHYGISRRKDLAATFRKECQPLTLPIEMEATLYGLQVETIQEWRKSKQVTLAYHSGGRSQPQFEKVLD